MFDRIATWFASIPRSQYELSDLPVWSLVLLCVLLLTQGLLLFLDGRKRGVRGYWAWALWGCLSLPLPTILYLLIARRKHAAR